MWQICRMPRRPHKQKDNEDLLLKFLLQATREGTTINGDHYSRDGLHLIVNNMNLAFGQRFDITLLRNRYKAF